jgi:hypothetical protein
MYVHVRCHIIQKVYSVQGVISNTSSGSVVYISYFGATSLNLCFVLVNELTRVTSHFLIFAKENYTALVFFSLHVYSFLSI